ncbi:MAG: hypothetical protein ACI35O_12415 [Bacillaceae bacterium]
MTKIAINGSASNVVEVLKAMENFISHQHDHGVNDLVVSVEINDEEHSDFDSPVSDCLNAVYNF